MEEFNKKGEEMKRRIAESGESVGVPIDMAPDPNVPPLHQGEKLDPRAMLEALGQMHVGGQSDKLEDFHHDEESEKP